MRRWLRELDEILRGEATRMSLVREGKLAINVPGLSVLLIALAAIYGVCMGSFALFHEHGPVYQQLLASAIKVPALFLLTVLVTFPSLYVFNALVGSRLDLRAVLRLLIAALGVTAAVLASLGPIVAFFSITSTSYPFVVLLNVAVFAISGGLGVSFLLQTLHRMSRAVAEWRRQNAAATPAPVGAGAAADAAPVAAADPQALEYSDGPAPLIVAEEVTVGPLDHYDEQPLGVRVKLVFTCWVWLFAFVGAQMSWVLRPFIGSPSTEFAWLRPRGSNFFESVLQTLGQLLP